MLVPVEKIGKPFQAIGRAVGQVVGTALGPQPTAPGPSTAETSQAWQNYGGSYYQDEAARIKHLQQLDLEQKEAAAKEAGQREKEEEELFPYQKGKAGFEQRQEERLETQQKQLDDAYKAYEKAPAEGKEAALQNLMAIESVVYRQRLPSRMEQQPPIVKEILAMHKLDPNTPPSQYPPDVVRDIERSYGLPFQRLQEQWFSTMMRRQSETRGRSDKLASVFSKALSDAKDAATKKVGSAPVPQGSPPNSDDIAARNDWYNRYQAEYAAQAHERYESLSKQFPDLQLAPLGEGPQADVNALERMRLDLNDIWRSRLLEGQTSPAMTTSPAGAPAGTTPYMWQGEADRNVDQNQWMSPGPTPADPLSPNP